MEENKRGGRERFKLEFKESIFLKDLINERIHELMTRGTDYYLREMGIQIMNPMPRFIISEATIKEINWSFPKGHTAIYTPRFINTISDKQKERIINN